MKLITNNRTLANGIQGLNIKTNKFKTQRISISFVLPLTIKDSAIASVLSRLLTRSTKNFPTPVLLQRQLLSLYGATLNSQVIKIADAQLFNINTTVLSNEFSLHQENLALQATDLLCGSLFEPNSVNNSFPNNDVAICKRLLIESLEGIINDKRKYAISQMFAKMCSNEPFGIEIGGNIETVEKITGEDIYNYWENMLKTAPVIISVIGSDEPDQIYNHILNKFNAINRSPLNTSLSFTHPKIETVQNITEKMNLTQGKLVMGFRSNISSLETNNIALRVMCDIFGGSPYSKLFTVVREKMSLCYYCAARLQSQKGFICVDSGVETQNIKATQDGVLQQLLAMQHGEFDNDVILASKMSLADAARSVTDSQASIETWYLSRIFDTSCPSPYEFIENLESVTKEDIVNAANTVVLDTIYTLQPMEDSE